MERRHTGMAHHLNVGLPFALHFVDEGRHTVNACVATTDDHYCPALLGHLEGLLGPVALTLHARVDALCAGTEIRLNKLEIVFVSYYYVGLANGLNNSRCNVLFAARAKAYDYDFRFLHHALGFMAQRYELYLNYRPS